MKTAIVHDWLTDRGGAEKVLHNLLEIYPDADLYCLVDFMSDRDRGFLGGRPVNTSFIQKLPFARKNIAPICRRCRWPSNNLISAATIW